MQHKHRDVIVAWADGATIEWRFGENEDWHPLNNSAPKFDEMLKYRIKPASPETTMTHEQLEHAWAATSTRWEAKLTQFANAVLAHAVETEQLVEPEAQQFSVMQKERELAIANAVSGWYRQQYPSIEMSIVQPDLHRIITSVKP